VEGEDIVEGREEEERRERNGKEDKGK